MAKVVTAPQERFRAVAMGELLVSGTPEDVLVAYGLGSCIALILYDPAHQIGGMLHALLPTPLTTASEVPARFVDQGIPLLLTLLERQGAMRAGLRAYLCGGAQILTAPSFTEWVAVGERNVLAAEQALRTAGIPLRTQDTGGTSGRTVKLYVADGRVTVRTLGTDEKRLDQPMFQEEG